ncbi:hypothetical protein P152DRAFT_455365 [Eremomyces bilateralis CBS 781.70]|uniref:Uncharacterized protein n=1 Tax=Eremomyces bilateralis CBS 781.70 TaxID=1392243 RepID=A0A6G1GC88_9PEZI|nr:uncharacterized protein P152DRAFT_455365 [Eremomyces bilateralis CBS 781.70]KAF1815644.1 hypothetical protein P152DRAFT_455365 [Eremomyces bilateralis CBS 781.70]
MSLDRDGSRKRLSLDTLDTMQVIITDKWRLEVQHKHHNYSRSLDPSTHNVYRRRTLAQKDLIESMTNTGARSMQILNAIQKEDPETRVSATDIRNERKAIRV